jgi:hypothetical protein
MEKGVETILQEFRSPGLARGWILVFNPDDFSFTRQTFCIES